MQKIKKLCVGKMSAKVMQKYARKTGLTHKVFWHQARDTPSRNLIDWRPENEFKIRLDSRFASRVQPGSFSWCAHRQAVPRRPE